ncbi:hypothetical protein PAPYR_3433 [Paratrimastix pyriformis]|uniref:Uncharacterized protein n=1 Tax=Paratrimastix pyriformis TaxID=342808 RepID=A0ABQ8UNL7_9EUKA|nr:hypothetical protein PAPYR_3433 [Paratrimastix pyriformis]
MQAFRAISLFFENLVDPFATSNLWKKTGSVTIFDQENGVGRLFSLPVSRMSVELWLGRRVGYYVDRDNRVVTEKDFSDGGHFKAFLPPVLQFGMV